MKQTARNCKLCQRSTLHTKDTFQFHWGCLLTVITCGLFIPIWLLFDLMNTFTGFRCQHCGTKN